MNPNRLRRWWNRNRKPDIQRDRERVNRFMAWVMVLWLAAKIAETWNR